MAWDGLRGGRRVYEQAGPGSWFWYRVGKNEMVVKRRGVAAGFSRGSRAFSGGGVPSGERLGEDLQAVDGRCGRRVRCDLPCSLG